MKSELTFLSDYVLLDVETTGLSPDFDLIIEIAVIRVVNHKITEIYSTLINPLEMPVEKYTIDEAGEILYTVADGKVERVFRPVNSFIESLTGITNRMLIDAPQASAVFPKVKDLIGSNTVVGCRTSFDMAFLKNALFRYCRFSFENNYVDIQCLARRLLFDLPNYKLSTLAKQFSINYHAHRAENDCLCTKAVYDHLRGRAVSKYGNSQAFEAIVKGNTPKAKLALFRPSSPIIDKHHILYGQQVFISGKFELANKSVIMQLLADRGAVLSASLNAAVNYIIISHNCLADILREKVSKCKDFKGLITELQLYHLLEHPGPVPIKEGPVIPHPVPSIFDLKRFMPDDYYEEHLTTHNYHFQSLNTNSFELQNLRNPNKLKLLEESAGHRCEICGEQYQSPYLIPDAAKHNPKETQARIVCEGCYTIAHMANINKTLPEQRKWYLNALHHYRRLNHTSFAGTLYAYHKFLHDQSLKQH